MYGFEEIEIFKRALNVHIVELHVAIVGCGQQHLRVRREAETAHRHGVTFERLSYLASGHIKYVDNPVDGSGRDVFSIRTLIKHKQRSI